MLIVLSLFSLPLSLFYVRAQSVSFLFALMSICMCIEMVTSHINSSITTNDATAMSPFAFFDVLIALQGVYLCIIFVCAPKPLRIIRRWWISNGSLDVAAFTELESLKKHSVLNWLNPLFYYLLIDSLGLFFKKGLWFSIDQLWNILRYQFYFVGKLLLTSSLFVF